MKRSWAMKWARDLETTKAKQARGVLNDGKGGFCCLGRLCVVVGAKGRRNNINMGISYHGAVTVLPSEVQDLVKMSTASGIVGSDECELSSLNDDGVSFTELAKLIRKRWKDL
jgi:hypothetical protein